MMVARSGPRSGLVESEIAKYSCDFRKRSDDVPDAMSGLGQGVRLTREAEIAKLSEESLAMDAENRCGTA